MDSSDLINIGIAVISAIFAAGGAYAAVRVELRFLNEKITRNREDIAEMRSDHREDVSSLHTRISHVEQTVRESRL